MFGHIPEVLGLLVVGLLIFGPRRMIELGGQVGKALRELQTAMKDMGWNPLSDGASSTGAPSTTLGKLSQLAQRMTTPHETSDTPATSAHVVETTAQPTPASDTATTATTPTTTPAE